MDDRFGSDISLAREFLDVLILQFVSFYKVRVTVSYMGFNLTNSSLV